MTNRDYCHLLDKEANREKEDSKFVLDLALKRGVDLFRKHKEYFERDKPSVEKIEQFFNIHGYKHPDYLVHYVVTNTGNSYNLIVELSDVPTYYSVDIL